MKRLYTILFLVSLISNQFAFAQDARFSQYFNSPLIVNPALAGNGIEHIRLTAIYRTQWAGMGTPFTTQGLSVDKVVNRVGIGATVTRNGAGDESIKTLNILGNLSYNLPLGKNKNHTLSGGVQVGIVNKSFDPSKLTFDNQYNPDQGYDPNQGSGEVFESTSITRPDINAGIMWQRGWLKNEIKFKPFIGISYSHLTKPTETYIIEGTNIPMKQTIYGGAGFMLSDKTEITPSMMYLSQGTFSETTFGSLLSYKLDNKNAIQLGLFNRIDDSFITYAGYQMNLLFVGMSYDINTGELSKTGKGTNAFEITLTYSPRPKRKKDARDPNGLTPQENLLDLIPAPHIPTNLTQDLAIIDIIPVQHSSSGESHANNNSETATTDQSKTTTDQTLNENTTPVQTTVTPVITEVVKPVDSDGDGVIDSEDACPFMKGSKATGGCPDSDNDGIIDSKDACPLEGGPSTNNGCPDPNIATEVTAQQLVKTYDHILFETGSTRLTTGDIFDIIERAVDVLYADETTSVLLSGHTDSEGGDAFNMNLSQSRANVVKAYLVKQGIDPTRIETVAYGESMPLMSNHLRENMKQNRRVELNIIRKK